MVAVPPFIPPEDEQGEETNSPEAPSSPQPQPHPLIPLTMMGDTETDSEGENESPSSPAVYKDVVVIGNGPSGITLSYFLAGNWPHYTGLGEECNEMLHYRLLALQSQEDKGHDGHEGHDRDLSQPKGKSLVEQDLTFLAQGLEGRSSNPVSLLFDTLNHPQADLGLDLPSLLSWTFDKSRALSHVVLGKGLPGGAWQSMDGNVLTISRGTWMELPEMSFRDWWRERKGAGKESRATVSKVAQYYTDYVKGNGLRKYFQNHSVVTSVKKVEENGAGSGKERRFWRRHTLSEIPVKGKTKSRERPQGENENLWKVCGYCYKSSNKIEEENFQQFQPFTYITKNLVLATGTTDLPNVLNVEGENLPFVLHSLNELETVINKGELNSNSDPVMIVGAGLSAADAIIAARFHSIPVTHVYRRNVEDPNLIFRRLPVNMYPEYHKVYQMMQFPLGYEGYKGHGEHQIVQILPDKRVKMASSNSCTITKVSFIVICIGSHPDLSFLGDLQFDLGVIPGALIDCKRNPLAINFSTHESLRHPGLYGLGPLIGENFVRFLQGGALAATNHLVSTKKNVKMY